MDLKAKRRAARKQIKSAREIINHMEKYIFREDAYAVGLGCAFLQVLEYHLKDGDLRPDNVHLAYLLRKRCGDEE
jgi:hypothetical protein